MAIFIQKRKPTKKALVGVVLGLVGMYLLVNQQQIVTDTMALIGSGVIFSQCDSLGLWYVKNS